LRGGKQTFEATPSYMYYGLARFWMRSWISWVFHASTGPSESSCREYVDTMDGETRSMLAEVFRPHNDHLFALLGSDLGWNSEDLARRGVPHYS
jgi:hypothetical protein